MKTDAPGFPGKRPPTGHSQSKVDFTREPDEGEAEWQETTTAALINAGVLGIGDGYRAKNSELVAEGLPFARAGNINNGFKFFDADCLPFHYVDIVGDKASLPGDTVFTSKGTVGRFGFVSDKTQKFVYSPQLCFWRSLKHDKILPRFIYYWMHGKEFLGQVEGLKGQTDMADYVNLADQRKMSITLPPMCEQKAIAAVLGSLDDKIDLLHRQNKTLEAMAETLFRQWFVEEAEDNWEEVSIGEFVEINRASIDKSYPHSTIQYLDTGSLTAGKIESLQLLSLDEAPSRAKRLVRHNDVLISTVRPDQKHYGIIKNPMQNLVVSTGFCVLTCTKIDPHFVYLLLTNSEMTDYLHTIAEGSTSTYPSLKPSDIGSVVFQRPPDSKLAEFSDFASDSWEKIEKNHIQIRTLEKLRDTLLPKLMSGEVRVALSEPCSRKQAHG